QDFFTTKFPFKLMTEGRARMADTFTGFAETLVPTLARLAVARPDVVSREFDLRKDGDLLKVVDADMGPEDIAWLEARLNEVPELRSWATMFNEAVVDTYGNREHESYWTELGAGFVGRCGIAGLENTVDRDVKFMSLMRALRDTDLDTEPFRMHMEKYNANPYGYAAIKVLDMVKPVETYRPMAGGGLEVSKAHMEPALLARA
ncbi:hypothetical protein, partial [Luteibacter sp.]|uniref:hypothetical protein n=1 Tax=Luteibacter sp. TaxID=1886636 RepID=UPI003F81AE70